MRLRNRQAYISTLPEGEPDKNKASQITRWLYFLVLFLIVSYLLYIGFTRFTQFQGRGQVELAKTIISPERGGQIISLFVVEGEDVQRGSLMTKIKASSVCRPVDKTRVDKLSFDLGLKKIEVDLLKKRILFEQTATSDVSLRRALELDKSRIKKNEQSARQVADLKLKIEALMNEIALQEAVINKTQPSLPVELDAGCVEQQIRAPLSGIVHSIAHKVYEFAPRGEPLVTLIANDAAVRIEAFVDNKNRRHIAVDMLVDVVFPDGLKTKGSVNHIFSSSAAFPRKKLKGYESLESNIRLHILPVSDIDEQIWRDHDRMEVTIRGFKE
ncbi:MAG: HlyD family efflux transporter periplasmic adaptor subunit [Gammaproteobacteria bacterium]|nr:HlyD family efflux transporter periplasmic adaptor subunit [Gammaproteobacteria bacterium]MBQ0840182.1 HlyD family efflux transporter periplasmic adaptor subunit [Gammaproteobacteria bacterium]